MKTFLISLVLLLGACAASGGLKPTLLTSPPSYLASFPLNSVTEKALYTKIGPPDSTQEILGKKAYVYELGEGFGKRKYTYLIENGVVVEVLYNDSGTYNGSTATQAQSN